MSVSRTRNPVWRMTCIEANETTGPGQKDPTKREPRGIFPVVIVVFFFILFFFFLSVRGRIRDTVIRGR